jgi:hypothetical protein
MNLTINGKDQELKFGFGFVNKMDVEFKIEQNGMDMGMGVGLGKTLLESTYSLKCLKKIIKAATDKTNDREIEVAIENYAEEHDDITSLYEDLLDEMGKSSLLKPMISKFEERTEAEQKRLVEQVDEN